jgi:hypothetical protein
MKPWEEGTNLLAKLGLEEGITFRAAGQKDEPRKEQPELFRDYGGRHAPQGGEHGGRLLLGGVARGLSEQDRYKAAAPTFEELARGCAGGGKLKTSRYDRPGAGESGNEPGQRLVGRADSPISHLLTLRLKKRPEQSRSELFASLWKRLRHQQEHAGVLLQHGGL